MATTTPNFGWSVPTSTDLVKDGATAIETLGDSIDASLVDLKGGTAGQVLSKNSNTDMDFVWVTDAAGDITGVTAGTGISGGGTSGTVTVTNSMATAITTAGDLIKGTGSGTFDRLGIGSTGQVLTVVAGAPAWAAAAGGATFSGCMLINSANISVANASQTTLTWDSEEIDVDGYHSTSTNTGRITIPTGKTGKFLISAQLRFSPSATGRRILYIYKNGTTELWSAQVNGTATNDTVFTGSYIISLSAGDYLECRTYQNSGGALDLQGPAPYSYFSATYLGA